MPGDSLIIDPWHQPEDGKVGHWLPAFQTPALVDASGRGNTATNSGTTIVESSRGPVRSFNATYLSSSTVPEVQNHTITAWVLKAAGLARMLAGICDLISLGGVEWAVDTNGKLQMAFYSSGIRGWYTATSLPAIELNKWYFISISRYNPTAEFSINGSTWQTVATYASSIQYNNDTFDLGHASVNSEWYGLIDDFRLFDRVLTRAEVRDLYARTKAPRSPRRRVYSVTAAPPAGLGIPIAAYHYNHNVGSNL